MAAKEGCNENDTAQEKQMGRRGTVMEVREAGRPKRMGVKAGYYESRIDGFIGSRVLQISV